MLTQTVCPFLVCNKYYESVSDRIWGTVECIKNGTYTELFTGSS